ncbi:uncharacterized protein BCR38DRAFT_196504 [Pseudomassariella vexata]|uniref:Uncharacterized protein n=1 Tax=Pseudomassariella vexata TaxID=1141098 RepID=A0A1Y2E1K7_9PEZI|nr:uncharacterized protein BCR38DRAFT_196504 [Pseudomassariella vexata]ORY65389.1 hypothetical protein BCR38DRAFT_196504 [Pseudomassariella vexata]
MMQSSNHRNLLDFIDQLRSEGAVFGAAGKNQSGENSRMVASLVISCMRQSRGIILTVVSADNQFANQPVTNFARDIDPLGERTLGLIAKPDKLEQGTKGGAYWIEMGPNPSRPTRCS